MALEIERRFLVAGDGWRLHADAPQALAQGYLSASSEGLTLRVRQAAPLPAEDGWAPTAAAAAAGSGAGEAWLTLKLPAAGIARHEFEYAIPALDAEQLLALCPTALRKRRHPLALPGGDWVLDVFEGPNAPLVIAEVELERCDSPVTVPPWCVRELTGDGRFSNAALARQPFAGWPDADRAAVVQLLAADA
jgi:CYTH domain-containing protein